MTPALHTCDSRLKLTNSTGLSLHFTPSLTSSLAKAKQGLHEQEESSRRQRKIRDFKNNLSCDSPEIISSVQSTAWKFGGDQQTGQILSSSQQYLHFYIHGFSRMLILTWHKFSLQQETPSRQGPGNERVMNEYPTLQQFLLPCNFTSLGDTYFHQIICEKKCRIS